MINLVDMAEMGILPDSIIRYGIRKRLKVTLKQLSSPNSKIEDQKRLNWIEELSNSPVAIVPEKANEQHYELPPDFFQTVLGENLKYSGGFWPNGNNTLDESEAEMLRLTCFRAELEDDQDILELGCGWGSLTLWMAEHYPNSRIKAVSNSHAQRTYIIHQAELHGLNNVEVITADMNDFSTSEHFDRVVSVEMFEHMRNYKVLMNRIEKWLKPQGKLFVHIFTHDKYGYPYLDQGEKDWMARYFFTGGQMPSHDLLPEFKQNMDHEKSWIVDGINYAKTSRAWLDKMDNNRQQIMAIFEKTYGKNNALVWFGRWRLFFMACEELFRYNGGKEWYISHYLFSKGN